MDLKVWLFFRIRCFGKESHLWLKLLQNDFNIQYKTQLEELINEADELRKIFSAIVEKKNEMIKI